MTPITSESVNDEPASLESFRKEVRDFIRSALPEDLRERVERGYSFIGKDDYTFWQRQLNARGWGAPTWPREYGGAGWTAAQNLIFEAESARLYCPRMQPQGVKMVGPIIYTFGTEEQKSRFLGPIRNADEWWCQGYSEPGAGSDLANLQTKAEREGDCYRVNGQKIWTTQAHWADWMFCLTRTSGGPRPQEGITFLLVDMRTPGITIKPIVTIDGAHHTNEVFLDDVMVPVSMRIGEEGQGWRYTKNLLAKERAGIAELGRARERLERLKRVLRDPGIRRTAGPFGEAWQCRVAELEIQIRAAEATTLRVLDEGSHPDPALTSVLKLRGSEISQAITSAIVDALGPHALRDDLDAVKGLARPDDALPSWAMGRVPEYLRFRAQTIAGGTSEVQRNILARMLFQS